MSAARVLRGPTLPALVCQSICHLLVLNSSSRISVDPAHMQGAGLLFLVALGILPLLEKVKVALSEEEGAGPRAEPVEKLLGHSWLISQLPDGFDEVSEGHHAGLLRIE